MISDTISHPDNRDMTCANTETRDKARQRSTATLAGLIGRNSKTPLQGLRIGIPIQTHLPSPSIQLSPDLLRHLKSLGAELQAVDLPSLNYTLPAYYVLASAEASSNLARFGGGWYGSTKERGGVKKDESGEERRFRVRTAGFGTEVKKRILAGTHALSAK
jgi:aspartyl-tRNA(Asn)/glutamyl-tRNA(Gln) amidotransferase subunit A